MDHGTSTADLDRFLHALADALAAGPDGDVTSTPPDLASEATAEAAHRLARQVAEAGESRDRATCELVSRLAHEIRTPLGSLLMTSELLLGQIETERGRQLAERLGTATREVRSVLEDTVELVKIRAGRSELAEPSDIDADWLLELIRESGLEPSGRPGGPIHAPVPAVRLVLESLARASRARDAASPATLELHDPWTVPFPGLTDEWLIPFSKSAPRGVGLQLARARAVLGHLGGDLVVRASTEPGAEALEIRLPRER